MSSEVPHSKWKPKSFTQKNEDGFGKDRFAEAGLCRRKQDADMNRSRVTKRKKGNTHQLFEKMPPKDSSFKPSFIVNL